ncbi:MAG: glucose-1-phosphate adenylyltransferase subunit GlgD [Firmicutes bacterium]|nr:glucose-1-phosphate adenylyltransferase subunit GlgD [Bacillota bacterium]
MQRVMGVINLAEPVENMEYLTEHRSLGAVPFGGRYRMIDFTLSNLVNAGVVNVSIFVRDRYRALMDHLGTGKEWDLDRHRDGLFLLPPDGLDQSAGRGDIELMARHLDYFTRSRQDTVILSGTSMLCNMDYRQAVEYHRENQADITMIYKPGGLTDYEDCATLLDIDHQQRVRGIQVNPVIPRSRNLSMNMYILSKELLVEVLDQALARGGKNWVRDCVIANLDQLKIIGYPFTGYLGNVCSLRSYYRTTMELLRPGVSRELFFRAGLVYTKVKNEAPTRYTDTAKVTNSLIANGCVIEGHVENSVLFRGVKVAKGAVVKDSVLMQKSVIGEQCHLQHVILDKDVSISPGKHLMGDPDYPLVLRKGTIL